MFCVVGPDCWDGSSSPTCPQVGFWAMGHGINVAEIRMSPACKCREELGWLWHQWDGIWLRWRQGRSETDRPTGRFQPKERQSGRTACQRHRAAISSAVRFFRPVLRAEWAEAGVLRENVTQVASLKGLALPGLSLLRSDCEVFLVLIKQFHRRV